MTVAIVGLVREEKSISEFIVFRKIFFSHNSILLPTPRSLSITIAQILVMDMLIVSFSELVQLIYEFVLENYC